MLESGPRLAGQDGVGVLCGAGSGGSWPGPALYRLKSGHLPALQLVTANWVGLQRSAIVVSSKSGLEKSLEEMKVSNILLF